MRPQSTMPFSPGQSLGRLAAWLILSVGLAGVGWAQPASHVILISIDGLRPEFYLDRTWPAPTVQQLAAEGSYAERVRGVFPTVTYPSHTTMVTGVLPFRHGVYYNQPFEPEGQTGRWYWHESAIQVDTLWDLLKRHGRATAAVSWPVTVGAPIDWLVPEYWSLDPEVERLAPMRDASSAGLWQELEQEATGRLSLRKYSADFMTRDDTSGAIAAYLFETYRPTLLAVHLLAADHFEHADGRESWRVRRAVAAADRALGSILDAVERAGLVEQTAIVVTGDHGFVDVHTDLAPNVWLAELGLQEPRQDRGRWRATFHTQDGSAFLHLEDPADEQAVEEVRRLLDSLPHRFRKLFRVVERQELDDIGADPRVPLALAARLGVAFVARATGKVAEPSLSGEHGYFPSDFPEIYTGFVASGAGLVRGEKIDEIGLEDIAPLILELLGLPPLEDADGLAPGILVDSAAGAD